MSQTENNDDSNMGTISDLSDQDILIKFCLDNKVNKTAIDELLKRGYDSLAALRLVSIEDLSSQNIPMGQRRLIFHIAQSLCADDSTSGHTGNTGSTSSAGAGNTGVSPATTTTLPTHPTATEVQPLSQQQQTSLVNDDYSQTLINTLLNQHAQLTAATGLQVSNHSQQIRTPSATDNSQQSGTNSSALPLWNDPQIHIASATGKSTSTFFDICDFVPQAVDEDLVVGGHGDQQLVIKTGPKKPKLESLTLSQWSVANLAILYRLVNEGKLVGPNLMDYLSYTTKVYQLVQRFSLSSVLLYDREYRKLQASMNFRWGTDVQHLHTLFLQQRSVPGSQSQGNQLTGQKRGNANQFAAKPKGDKRVEICRNFNSDKGCSFEHCKFKHKCIVPGCSQAHSATVHSHEKK